MKQYLIILILGLLSITSGCIHLPNMDKEEEVHYTEFYLLGPEKEASNYPSTFNSSSSQLVYIGVTNEEGVDMSYSIEISLNNISTGSLVNDLEYVTISNLSYPVHSFHINVGETIEFPCNFHIEEIGDLSLYFCLIKDGDVYREFRLEINVK